MASSISAGTTSSTALVATADTSGALVLQTNNGTTAVTLDTSQNATFAGTLTTAAKGIAKASLPAGAILQVVQTALTSTTTLIANGTATAVSGMSSVITPTSSTSKILVQLMLNYSCTGTTYGGYFTRNGATIGVGNAGSGQQQVGFGMSFTGDANQTNSFIYNYLDSPATTSALTYQLYVNNDNTATLYVNRSQTDSANSTGKRSISTILLYEIAA